MALSTARATIRVRYAETDQMGVVYYANYFVWCEIGRVEFFRQLGHDYKSMEIEDDCHLPVADASCRYRASALYDDEVIIETRVKQLRGPLIKFGYRMLRKEGEREVVLAEAETIHICVGRNMQKRNMPDRYAHAIRETMAEMATAQE